MRRKREKGESITSNDSRRMQILSIFQQERLLAIHAAVLVSILDEQETE
jgi:hypothetical protein